MMYGFGDDQTPYKESVELVEVTHLPFASALRAYFMLLKCNFDVFPEFALYASMLLHLASEGHVLV